MLDRAVARRVMAAAHGRPGAAAIARAAARLYDGLICPRLDPIIVNPASIGARRGWAGGHGGIRG
eukprot:5826026-Pyramimonas_sp.AAC.1